MDSGTHKRRLEVAYEQSIIVMCPLESPEGYLTDLLSMPAPPDGAGDAHLVPLVPAASDPLGRQGYVGLISRSPTKGNDDGDWRLDVASALDFDVVCYMRLHAHTGRILGRDDGPKFPVEAQTPAPGFGESLDRLGHWLSQSLPGIGLLNG